jgi:hypothetical protein
MQRKLVPMVLFALGLWPVAAVAQDFKVFDRAVQVHGFASQGYVYTAGNNWLTMDTNGAGSFGFTEMGLNASTPVTDKFRVGAQVFDRNLGQLGQYHPSLDWAVADYRFKSWFGVRGGKVKTVLGLFTETEDQDFLRVFALLPQSVYPTDIRDATIAHLGGDIYGTVFLRRHLGELSYTGYAGNRLDNKYSGSAYLLSRYGIHSSSGALQYGGDLRWKTPLHGLLIGASRLDQDLSDKGKIANPFVRGKFLSFHSVSNSTWINQFYGEYTQGKLRIDSEYNRYFVSEFTKIGGSFPTETTTDVHGWYTAGSYRVMKRLAMGAYYSRYQISEGGSGALIALFNPHSDTSLPSNHIYDKVVTARVDLTKNWNVKVEGHFMGGYGLGSYPDGFYPQVNLQGFKPNTNALVVKTSINF